jgi:two-component system, NarL family, response regulator
MRKPPRIRVLIAEDHLIARLGLAAVVNAQADLTVVAEATDGKQAVTLYRKHQPDVTVIDLFMPVMTGFEAISAIHADFPNAPIVALSTYSGDEDIHRAFLAGARSYLTKDALHDELVKAIHSVYQGRKYLPEPIAHVLATQSPCGLSLRELEVLNMIVQGKANKQIAYELSISEDTVKHHIKNILRKLGVEDRTQAVTAAIRRGVVHLNS